MNTGMEPFERLAERATARARQRLHQQKVTELVALIDELSGEMGVAKFRQAVRDTGGYDIDACHFTLMRRGVDRTN